MSFTSIDLNLLRVLNAVLTEGSVAKAARQLHVTPSAVSNALAKLRALIGDRLITKKGRGIVPTPRALELAPVLAKSLRDLQNAVHGSAFNSAVTTRRFTIALSDANQLVFLPRIASLFATEMPRARLRSISIDSLAPLEGLAGSEVDVVIGPRSESTEVHSELLVDQPTVLVCRRDHPIALKPSSRETARSLRHVAVEMAPGQGLRDMTEAAYSAAGITRDVAISVPSFTSAAAVVATTDLVATIPEPLYDVLGSTLRLRTLPAPIPPLVVPMKLCWHERTHSDPAATAFRELVRRAVKAVSKQPGKMPVSDSPASVGIAAAIGKRGRSRRS